MGALSMLRCAPFVCGALAVLGAFGLGCNRHGEDEVVRAGRLGRLTSEGERSTPAAMPVRIASSAWSTGDRVVSFAASPTGGLVVLGRSDGVIDVVSGPELDRGFSIQLGASATKLQVSAAGAVVWAASRDGRLRRIALPSGRIDTVPVPAPYGHFAVLESVGRLVVGATTGSGLDIWRLDGSERIGQVEGDFSGPLFAGDHDASCLVVTGHMWRRSSLVDACELRGLGGVPGMPRSGVLGGSFLVEYVHPTSDPSEGDEPPAECLVPGDASVGLFARDLKSVAVACVPVGPGFDPDLGGAVDEGARAPAGEYFAPVAGGFVELSPFGPGREPVAVSAFPWPARPLGAIASQSRLAAWAVTTDGLLGMAKVSGIGPPRWAPAQTSPVDCDVSALGDEVGCVGIDEILRIWRWDRDGWAMQAHSMRPARLPGDNGSLPRKASATHGWVLMSGERKQGWAIAIEPPDQVRVARWQDGAFEDAGSVVKVPHIDNAGLVLADGRASPLLWTKSLSGCEGEGAAFRVFSLEKNAVISILDAECLHHASVLLPWGPTELAQLRRLAPDLDASVHEGGILIGVGEADTRVGLLRLGGRQHGLLLRSGHRDRLLFHDETAGLIMREFPVASVLAAGGRGLVAMSKRVAPLVEMQAGNRSSQPESECLTGFSMVGPLSRGGDETSLSLPESENECLSAVRVAPEGRSVFGFARGGRVYLWRLDELDPAAIE